MIQANTIDLITGETGAVIPFRNTLLQALYPDIRVAILKADPHPEARPAMVQALGKPVDGLELDFATGAKKSGEFIATNKQVGRRFWNSPEETVAYGSNLLTDCCQEPVTCEIRVLVVQDGEYGTGDCHAKCSPALAYELGNENADRAAQYRLAVDRYLAKGTMLPDISVPHDIDAIIPRSAFKSSQKPDSDRHTWTAQIAVQGWSERRQVKMSYSILQWFSFATLEADILTTVEEKAKALREAGRSSQSAVEFLKLHPCPDDENELLIARILSTNVHGQLDHHPWVVAGITRMLARRWMHLALGGGVRMTGLMAVPDDSLPEGVVSSPNLPAGAVIATRYPVRSWADVQVWENVRRPWTQYNGIVAMSHSSAARLGGDFDGDYFNFLPANEYPSMTAEIRAFAATRMPPPVVKTKERRASSWDRLPEVCLDNADNMVGLIACYIAQANAQGQLDLVDALAPELQIAVDKFKYNVDHDLEKLNEIGRQLLPLTWLSDRDSTEAFVKRPIHVDEGASDTISKLASYVVGFWEAPEVRAAPLASFAHILPETPAHREAARELRKRYGRLIAEAIKSKRDLGPIFDILREWAASKPDPEEWAKAIWHAVHHPKATGTGSLAFHAFPEQVIKHLHKPAGAAETISIVGLKYNEWADDLKKFDGAEREMAIRKRELDKRVRLQALVEGRVVGFVSAETATRPGTYRARLTWNGAGVVTAHVHRLTASI